MVALPYYELREVNGKLLVYGGVNQIERQSLHKTWGYSSIFCGTCIRDLDAQHFFNFRREDDTTQDDSQAQSSATRQSSSSSAKTDQTERESTKQKAVYDMPFYYPQFFSYYSNPTTSVDLAV